MKVKLLARKGSNKAGAVVEYDDASAQWLIGHGYAESVKGEAKSDSQPSDVTPPDGQPVQRRTVDAVKTRATRGRPRKDA